MGIFDSLRGRPDGGANPPAAGPQSGGPGGTAANGFSAADGRASLERRRDELLAQVAELHWDLGGLAYEMAIRDHFRLDVLVRRAAELQERDAELGELERVLSLRGEHVDTGTCPDCGAVHGRGALYCWHCGKVLMERVPSAAAKGAGGQTPGAPVNGAADQSPGAPVNQAHTSSAADQQRAGAHRSSAEGDTLILPPGAPVG